MSTKKLYQTDNFYVGIETNKKDEPTDNLIRVYKQTAEGQKDQQVNVLPVDGEANTERTFNIACRMADLHEAQAVPYKADEDGGKKGLAALSSL